MKHQNPETHLNHGYRLSFVVITVLFMLWGFGHSFIDVLNSHFESALHTTKAHAAWVHLMVYGGHFLIALPAGFMVRRWGYRKAMLSGLLLYALGALLFVPAEGRHHEMTLALLSLFVVGCGLGSLEVAANPYVAALGSEQTAARRLNLALAFNGLGLMAGPIVGGWALFGSNSHDEWNVFGLLSLSDVAMPYLLLGTITIIVAVVFSRLRLPEIHLEAVHSESTQKVARIWQNLLSSGRFRFGMLTLFLYVMAQTGINSTFVYYATDCGIGLTHSDAARLLGGVCLLLFLIGRLAGSFVMKYVRPATLLSFAAVVAVICSVLAIFLRGHIGLGAVLMIYLCESIMYPTLFSLCISGTKENASIASSLLEMSVVGGAVAPMLMGYVADLSSAAQGFVLPLCCFVVILIFSRKSHA